jgi:MFS transporter, DHA2 family, multidrug resistance protein
VVNLRVLDNRTLAITTIFTFVVGIGLFTSVFVYPVLCQRILGWTPLMTGLSLLPPTMVAIFMFPFIGRAMSKGANPLPFVVIGFLFFIAFGLVGGSLGDDLSNKNVYIPLALRAFGISMMQLPLINASVATLPPKDYPQGIAINNMIRQLGGSFGIAIANNYIASHYAQHRADLVSNVVAGSGVVTERMNTITQGLISRQGSDLTTATQQAYKALDLAVDKQAYFLSYLDTFRLIALFFIIVFPLIFFLKLKKQARPEEKAALKAAVAEAH